LTDFPNTSGIICLECDNALHIALQLQKAGALAEAEMLYRRVLDVAPGTLDALHYLGLLCHHQKRTDEAAELIGRIIALDPTNADAHNNLGNVYESMGDDAKAEAFFRRAIGLNPDHGPAHNNLGVILAEQQRIDEAIEMYRRAVQLSPGSGEFHYNFGNALRRNGDMEEAVAAYQEATRINPDHLGAWQGLARVLRISGRQDEAVTVFDNLLRMNPGNPVFSYLRSACVGADAPERAPDAYVQQIFDDAAEYFDRHLEELEYRAPSLLMEALASVLPPPDAALDILDAGCGTGLCGPLLRPHARKLVGVDLSQGMLGKAALREVYDDLYQAELTQFMEHQGGAYDVIVSADTLCYFGELDQVFRGAAKSLKPRGILAFTLEDLGEGPEGNRLNSSGRYSHARGYLERALGDCGLEAASLTSVVLRSEGKQPVTGHLVLARKSTKR
jgi:predicted TPR repeat methyltransferase